MCRVKSIHLCNLECWTHPHPLCIHDSTRLRSRTRWLSGTTVETVMPVTCDLTPKYKHITKSPWLRVQSSRAIASRHWRLPWHSLNVERVSFNRDCSSSYDWRWNGFLRNDIKNVYNSALFRVGSLKISISGMM